ncbi:DUF4974 domain-containing protein [Bacteroides sp. OttesenSCG-928-D19]|nr:DUF4974 domain-containing protein [Bacteroides sp. OttesenSCG-928-D19]
MESTTDRYKALLDKYLKKEATGEEIKLLARWMMQEETFEEFDSYCEERWHTQTEQIDTQTEQEMWKAISTKIEKKKKKQFHLNPLFYRIAVSILLPICVGLGAYIAFTHKAATIDTFEVMADRGQKSSVVLPDGTKVWINSATRLKYQPHKNERRVALEGEAYFEVAKDPKKKFIVNCHELNVEALGTAFNVKGYPTDDFVTVALLEGSVKVYNHENTAILNPNQQVSFLKTANTFVRSDINDEREIDFWRRNILYFRSASLEEIAKTLERMYGITVEFDNQELKQIPYSGSIRNSSLNNVLHIISLTYSITYEINNDVITLKKI